MAYDGDDALGCCSDAPALVVKHEAGRRLGHGGGPGAPSEPPLLLVVVQRGPRRTAGGPGRRIDPLAPGRGALLALAGRRGADGDGAAREKGQGGVDKH